MTRLGLLLPRIGQRSLVAGLMLIVFALGACTTPATSSGMLPAQFDVSLRHPGSVQVQVAGGCDDCGLGQSKVSNAAFSEAVVNAIRASKVFEQVAEQGGSDYILSVSIFRLEEPLMGFSMRADMEAGWTLRKRGLKAPVWQQAIQSDYTATFGDTPIGAQRARYAYEGAAQENIRRAIAKLSRVSLPN